MQRRDFLLSLMAAAGGLALPTAAGAGAGLIHQKARRPLRILFLGGTRYVGPAIVDLALERGHEVTLFNRGMTNPWIYTHLERLVGDRYPDRGAGLGPLEGTRRWDVVIDTWQGSPLAVERTAELLRDRVGSYVYISSIAVNQASFGDQSFDETAELGRSEMPTSFATELSYPARKQLGEAAVASAFPGRHTIPRAYGIVGTDARGRLDDVGIPYWPVRLHRGGEILAPGDGRDLTQWTDVRDLAELTLHAIEKGHRGVYNVSRESTFAEYLAELATLVAADLELVWVPAPFLFERGLRSFSDIPQFVWRGERECCFFHARTEKARAVGFRPRTARETFGPVLDPYLLHHAATHELDGELPRREGELVATWKAASLGE